MMTVYAEQLREQGKDPVVYLQALRFDFETGGHDTSGFGARALREARKNHMRYDGRSAAQTRMGREKQAVTEEMIIAAVQRYFPKTLDLRTEPTERHDAAIAMTGAVLLFNWALRPCHIASAISAAQAGRWTAEMAAVAEEAGRPIEEDVAGKLMAGHTLLACDVFLGYLDAFDDNEEKWFNAHSWCLRDGDFDGRRVDRIMVQILTNKSDQHGAHPMRKFAFAGASEGEGHLVRMVAEVARVARYSSERDQFLSRVSTRRPTERVNLRSRAVSALAKQMAEEAGLPPELFSAKSFKIGAITAIKAAGVSAADTAAGLGHRSVGASSQYVRDLLAGSTGALGLTQRRDNGGYDMESLRRNTAVIEDSMASRGQDGVSEITDAGAYSTFRERRGDDETSAGATWEDLGRDPPAKRRRVAPTRVEATEPRGEALIGRTPPLETVIARHEVVGELLHRGMRREFGDEYDTALQEGLPTPYDSSDGEDHRRPDGTSAEDALVMVIARALRNEGVQYTARDPMARTTTSNTADVPREPATGAPTGNRGMGITREPGSGGTGNAITTTEGNSGAHASGGTCNGSVSGAPGNGTATDGRDQPYLPATGPDTATEPAEHTTTEVETATSGAVARRPARGGARAARQSGRGSRGTGRR
jgi:hypothetical protein